MDNSRSETNTNSHRKRAVHDKASYGITATPPSPSFTSPSLTQSTSNTNSTSTPSTPPLPPTTPPRSSRSRTRYPDLGRVPLHRRGTSKTYERLEDLLREAGYKETRVFTPEGERGESSAPRDPQSSSDHRGGVRNSMGAFVGFLAGLMPNAAVGASTSSLGNADEVYSPPMSPLTRRGSHTQHEIPSSSEPHSPSPMTTSVESLDPTPRASRRMTSPSRSTTPLPPSIYSYSQSSQQDLRRPKHLMAHRASDQYSYTSSSTRRPLETRPSQTSLYYQSTRGSSTHLPAGPSHQHRIVQPRPSRAGAYLRHMASAPNMPKRPNSTPAHHAHQHRKTLFLNDSDGDSESKTRSSREYEHSDQPPLPRTWLESVTRAVLFGGIGAYIGGPPDLAHWPSSHSSSTHTPVNSPKIRPKTLRPTRSSLSQVSPHQQQRATHLRLHPASPTPRNGLSDRTNTRKSPSGGGMLAPELFAQIGRGRARTSAGEVSRTRVVCRSAPASRSGSAVRGVGGDGREKRHPERDRDQKNGKGRELRGRARGRTAERDRLPSLANTRTEGDAWVSGKRARAKTTAGAENRYLSGWGVEADPDSSDDGGERLSSSEEEEELNLAKMLVNPKRQASIKSLRKHLVDEDGASASSRLRKAAAGIRPRPSAHRSASVRQITTDTDWDGSEAEEWGHGWVRKSARRGNSQDDDDNGSFAGFLGEGSGAVARSRRVGVFGSGRSGTGRGRLGIPGPWGLGGS